MEENFVKKIMQHNKFLTEKDCFFTMMLLRLAAVNFDNYIGSSIPYY